MSREVIVTITFKYTSESTLLEKDTSHADVDAEAYGNGEFDIPELLDWAEDGSIDVEFKQA